MTVHSTPLSRLSQINRLQLDVVERLEADFPEAPALLIYEKVREARGPAAKHLADPSSYRDLLEQQARALIVAATTTRSDASPLLALPEIAE